MLRAKAEQYDEKARRLEKKLKHDYHTKEEEAELEDEYLYAVKAKVELMKHFD